MKIFFPIRGILVLCLLIGFASAANSCTNENQIIMSLQDQENSHGALWNDEEYDYKICYEQVFGVLYEGANPHNCANNLLLRLSQDTNAHAQNSSLSYPTQVCYGDLSCSFVAGNCNEKNFVVSLSGNSNAHLSANPGAYSVCCSSSAAEGKTAFISSPLNNAVYFIGNPIIFSQRASDKNLIISWEIGETLEQSKKNSSFFTYSYSNPGIKKIILNVTDKNGDMSSASVYINVLGTSSGFYVYPQISSPKVSENLENPIKYNGSESYVIESSGLPGLTLTCAGGNCPSLVSNCPSGYSGSCPISIGSGERGYGEMEFNWTFTGSGSSSSEFGLGKVSGSKGLSSGNKIVTLQLKSHGVSASVSNSFYVMEEILNGCGSDGRFWYENSVPFSTELSGNCGGADKKVGGLQDCCPVGRMCTNTDSGIRCLSTNCIRTANKNGVEASIKLCSDYNYISSDKENQCNSDCNYASDTDEQITAVKSGLKTGEQIASINCAWVNNNCIAQYTKKSSISNGLKTYQCLMEIASETACQNGEKTVTYSYKKLEQDATGKWITVSEGANAKCEKTESVKVKCGGEEIILPFFSLLNLFLASFGIVAVYLIIIKKLNKKR